jgi:hypothetical protein
MHHRQLVQFGPDSLGAGLGRFQACHRQDDNELFAAETRAAQTKNRARTIESTTSL